MLLAQDAMLQSMGEDETSDLPDLVDSESDEDDDEIPTSHTMTGKGMRKGDLESSPVIRFMSPRFGLFQGRSIQDLTFDSGATEDMTIMNKAEVVKY